MDALSEAIVGLLRRQKQIDERLQRIEAALNLQQPIEPQVVASAPAPPITLAAPLPAAIPTPTAVVAPPRPGLETNIGLTLINRVGVITLVLGIGFFFKWAVDNQWIGPEARVILGLLSGVASLAAADFLWRKKQEIFAQGITALGIGILYLSGYAAFGFYQLIPQAAAFLFLFSVTLLAVALALRYASVAMAALGLFAGYWTPVLLSKHEDRPGFLFTYVLILDAGALWLSRKRNWRQLEALSWAATGLLYGGWLIQDYTASDQLIATVFALAFYAIFSTTVAPPLLLLTQIATGLALIPIWHDSADIFSFLMLLLAAGGLVLVAMRRTSGLALTTFLTFWGVHALWAAQLPDQRPVELMFAGISSGFLLFLIWAVWQSTTVAESSEVSVLQALNSIVYFSSSYALLNTRYHAWMGLLAVVLAGIQGAVAAWLGRTRRTSSVQQAALISLGVGFGFLVLAAPIQFTGYRITMTWSLELAALAWIARSSQHAWPRIGTVGLSLLILFRLAAVDSWIYSDLELYPLLRNARFVTFLLAAMCIWLSAYWNQPWRMALLQYIGGHLILLWGLILEDFAWAVRNSSLENRTSVQTVSTSILLATYGLILIAAGVMTRRSIHRIAGLALLGLVIAKLYAFDVWQLGRVYRISAFVALGVLLLSTSFLYSRFRAAIDTLWKDEPPAA